jgi:hypothetical protein
MRCKHKIQEKWKLLTSGAFTYDCVIILYITLPQNKLLFLVPFYAFFHTRKWLLAGNGTPSSKCIPEEAAKVVN